MGKVKRISASIHLGILESVILVFILLVWTAGIYEAYFLSYIQGLIYHKGRELPIATFDIIANSIPIIIGSFSAMVLPVFLEKAKSEFSPGGSSISPLEIAVIFFLILLAMGMPFIMWHKCSVALEEAAKLNYISESAKKLRYDTIKTTIIANIVVDLLLGLWSIYEIETHNNKLKIIKIGKKKVKPQPVKIENTPEVNTPIDNAPEVKK